MKLEKLIEDALIKAIRILPEDVEKAIRKAEKSESSEFGRIALKAIVDNIDIAREKNSVAADPRTRAMHADSASKFPKSARKHTVTAILIS